jgi:hypothetical protein
VRTVPDLLKSWSNDKPAVFLHKWCHSQLTSYVMSFNALLSAEVVHINEVIGGAETGAYLLQFDSIHGTYSKKVEAAADDSGFSVDGR